MPEPVCRLLPKDSSTQCETALVPRHAARPALSGLHLRAHARQNCPVVADVSHPRHLRRKPRHPVHSPEAYRQLQVQSALFSPIHFRSAVQTTIQADHNQGRLKAKRNISYTPTSSRSYVALTRRWSSKYLFSGYILQRIEDALMFHTKRLSSRNKGLNRDLGASRPPARERRRMLHTVPARTPATESPPRPWPKQQTRRVAAPASCSGTSGTRLFACRKPEPRTRARIPCRHTRRWA